MNKIKIEGKKSIHQQGIIKNITAFFNLQEKIVGFFRDYFFLLSEAKYKTKDGGLKILSPKKMLQRFLIVLAQVKAGNNSENLLNEIWEIIYSLFKSK